MKELSIEEKAKAYDEAKARMSRAFNSNRCTIGFMNEIFPELKESEDDKIREQIIYAINKLNVPESEKNKLLAWLEKQGNEPNWCHHKVDLSGCSEEYRKAYYDGWNNCNQQHSQCKSERNDVVKCLINGMKFYYEDNEEATWGTEKFSMKVKDILSWLEKQSNEQKDVDKSASAFTIRDAKDGDFLACPLPNGGGEQVFIFKEIGKREYIDDCIEYYCRVCQGVFYESNMGFMGTASDEFKPATWQQRTLLIRKMREAGYEWNPDAKVLKKIKRKSQRMVSAEAKEILLNESEREALRTEYEKGRADAIAEMQKEWSEEDEEMYQETIGWFEKKCFPYALENDNPARESIRWLKSLKDRYIWKPSDEQMVVLELASKYERVFTPKQIDILIGLKEQLKKIKG